MTRYVGDDLHVAGDIRLDTIQQLLMNPDQSEGDFRKGTRSVNEFIHTFLFRPPLIFAGGNSEHDLFTGGSCAGPD